ncbi:MAG: sulfatase [Planctomycetes bacterium]|nr:sulfatase [Planctomycetota bacterium]
MKIAVMDNRPNILLIVGEDTGLHLGCYGDPDARTPALDAFAAQGLRATHAFTHCPVCAPSRSGLVTGLYPYSFGSHHMRSRMLDPPPMFTRALKDAGWRVSWPSKTDFNFEMRGREISDTRDWMAEGLPCEGPWFCYTNLGVTHESSMWPIAQDDWSRHLHRLRDQLPPSDRHDPAGVHVPPYLPETPEVRADLARHHDNFTILDRQFADILAQLEASGQADNTIVIFLADHGAGIPRGKRWCYDLGTHLPLLVRWPGRIAPGTVHQGMVGWVDIAPQILAWCGIETPPGMQGTPFLDSTREYCFGGRDRMDCQFDRIRFARSRRWRYIRNFRPDLPWAQRNAYMERMPSMAVWRRLHAEGSLTPVQAAWFARTKPAEELYDCEADPWQLRNLADDPACTAELQHHRAALDAHLESVGDLGSVHEDDLIARGVIADQREEYRSRIAPLPAPCDNLGGPWDYDGSPWHGPATACNRG